MFANLALLHLESKGLHRCLTVSLYFMELPEIRYRQRTLFKSQIILRKIKSLPQSVAKIVLLVERAKRKFFSQWHSRLKLVARRGRLLHVHLARAVY